MSKLRYQTLRENVTKVIREKILNRELQPGMRIIEQNLSEELRNHYMDSVRYFMDIEGLPEDSFNVEGHFFAK